MTSLHPKIPTPVDEFVQTEFDYLICGGGTAGCTIAARLSENPNVLVGVIEAGKDRIGDPTVDTPALFTQMLEDPEYDWCMYTEPQVPAIPLAETRHLSFEIHSLFSMGIVGSLTTSHAASSSVAPVA